MKRRDFLKTSGVLAGATAIGSLSITRGAHAAGSDLIKLGLVGCGGRGRGALQQRLEVGDNVKVVAVADAFEGAAKSTAEAFSAMDEERVDLTDGVFFGLDAYKYAIDKCDSAIIATSPGFRPVHFAYAVEKGKHVFMEKPCAVDARGYKMTIAAAKMADEKNLKVVCGYQRHYQNPYIATFEQVKAGKIGKIMYSRVYWNGDGIWERPRQADDTEMSYQMRNWFHFNWLCGDNIVEQHCHNIDVGNWFHSLGDPHGPNAHPIKCNAMGGREVRKFPRFKHSGHRYDHFFCEFTYADGSQMFSQCRHIANCWNNVSETFYGVDGTAWAGGINDYDGNSVWRFEGSNPDPYKHEHVMHAKYIREDEKHNDAWFAGNSSMTSVLGRYAACSGQEIMWDDAVENGRDEFPYDLIADLEANNPTDFWDAIPPITPDTAPPVQPGEGEFIYENSVPVPGQWKWNA
ncbi:MAG: Gfo/Idh/MocA family oxidoreductase [Thermoguttaceae bacterium]|jgi:myo-inositol 2-dehydrogenase/D-chiro-inositol 1-dehydrogenase|nr:Gfo/Idh/MocA family oxidoreductase [Thermoguttaceae bacterium]